MRKIAIVGLLIILNSFFVSGYANQIVLTKDLPEVTKIYSTYGNLYSIDLTPIDNKLTVMVPPDIQIVESNVEGVSSIWEKTVFFGLITLNKGEIIQYSTNETISLVFSYGLPSKYNSDFYSLFFN